MFYNIIYNPMMIGLSRSSKREIPSFTFDVKYIIHIIYNIIIVNNSLDLGIHIGII